MSTRSPRLFRRSPCLLLIARIHRDNTASARIARKAGFQKTGVADKDPNIEVYRIRLDDELAENADEVQPFARH
jgi:RimJ/RimL family protein N-acetyltransferase